MAELIAWKNVEQLNPEAKYPPRRRLMVGVRAKPTETPAPQLLICLEEDEARLLGVDLEAIPEEPVRVRLSLEVLA